MKKPTTAIGWLQFGTLIFVGFVMLSNIAVRAFTSDTQQYIQENSKAFDSLSQDLELQLATIDQLEAKLEYHYSTRDNIQKQMNELHGANEAWREIEGLETEKKSQ